jgi:SnoaL-like domain
MDRERLDDWLEGYRRAWEEADTQGVLELFAADARYRSHPLRPVHAGHEGIAAYWARATADQADVRVRFGDPVVDGDRVAVEWWTTMGAGGDPVTLVGCLFLAFAGHGRCRDLREYWNLADGLVDPPPDWGRHRPGPSGRAAEHARRWSEGYERAWRAADPEAAAALYAPDTHYRSEPFRAPHLGREGVLAYTRAAYATEADQDPHFGTPVASDTAAAVEWWATTIEDGRPATLIGCSILTFTPAGQVATARDHWFLEPGTHHPFDGWGR